MLQVLSSCTFTVENEVKLPILLKKKEPQLAGQEGGREGGHFLVFLSSENITANICSIKSLLRQTCTQSTAGLVTASLCLHGNSNRRSRNGRIGVFAAVWARVHVLHLTIDWFA